MKNKVFSGIVIVFLLSASVYLGREYQQVRPLTSIAHSIMPAFDKEEKGVDVQIKALSHHESKQLLGHDLISKGVQPLQVTIQNNSPNEYSLDPDYVDVETIETKKVLSKVGRSALGRSIAFKALSFFFWPMMIPGTVDTVVTMRSEKKLKKDYKAKVMKEEVIPPYSLFNRILFMPNREMKDTITVTLIDVDSRQHLAIDVSPQARIKEA